MSGAQMPRLEVHGGSAPSWSVGVVHGPPAVGAVDSCRPEPVDSATNWLPFRMTPGSGIGWVDTGCGAAWSGLGWAYPARAGMVLTDRRVSARHASVLPARTLNRMSYSRSRMRRLPLDAVERLLRSAARLDY